MGVSVKVGPKIPGCHPPNDPEKVPIILKKRFWSRKSWGHFHPYQTHIFHRIHDRPGKEVWKGMDPQAYVKKEAGELE